MTDNPIFEVYVGEKHFRIWACGRTEGFGDEDKPVIVVNRIPRLIEGKKRDE